MFYINKLFYIFLFNFKFLRFSIHFKVIFFINFLFSTTNFILIERYSTDLLIFILISLIIFLNQYIKIIFIFIGTFLKFYPFFSLLIFIKDKKFFFISFFALSLFLYFFYLDQILSTNENLIEMALFIAYGSRTMLKAFYFLSENYNFFINENNLDLFRIIFISLIFIYSVILTLLGYFNSRTRQLNTVTLNEQYFLIGSSIYIGTFIFAANADYRLIFLIFAIPYILDIKNILIKYILIFCIIISINSFLFQFGDPLSVSFLLGLFYFWMQIYNF